MPVGDDRIERALREAAPEVDTTGVVERVARKRARRRTVRRVEVTALATVLAVVIGLTAVLMGDDGGRGPNVAAPGAGFAARVVHGDRAVTARAGREQAPKLVTLDTDEGYLRGPLFVSGSTVSLAAYDRTGGTFTFPPSRIVRVDGTRVVDQVKLKAEILSITEGEGARWAVTRNHARDGGGIPSTFLKRIGPDGTVTSVLLPAGSEPAGSVAAVGGAVWVPVRDGVVQFDAANGTLVRHISLPPSDARSVALVGKAAYVTDGEMIRRLDPSNGSVTEGLRIGDAVLRGIVPDWLLVETRAKKFRLARVGTDLRATSAITLPAGFVASTVSSSGTRSWVTGTVGGVSAIVLLNDTGVRATVILENGPDATLAWTGANTVAAISGGQLFRIPVKS